jgi:mannan endo-1,4-beta-mannosidase
MKNFVSTVIWILISISMLAQCSDEKLVSGGNSPLAKTNDILVDSLASPETIALYANLKTFTQDKVLFGHQETTAYGVGWTDDGFGNRSDVKDVCGDFPAVYGWDIGDIGQATNLDGVLFSQLKTLIRGAYERGGINTISIHLDNPVTGGNAWDTTPAVSGILPGASHHESFRHTLDLVADFIKSLKAGDGTPVPVIFRPFHEHNGDWFWWGRGPATEQEYIALWRFTVEYLIHEKDVHSLIFAISPDRSRIKNAAEAGEYLYAYPGDDYIDIMGLDNYFDLGSHWNQAPPEEQAVDLVSSLETIVQIAEDRDKIPALTETGLDKLQIPDWWTGRLLAGIVANQTTRRIAYLLVWRNASTEHFHAPYPGQASAADFILFYNSPITVFESDLPDMYSKVNQ